MLCDGSFIYIPICVSITTIRMSWPTITVFIQALISISTRDVMTSNILYELQIEPLPGQLRLLGTGWHHFLVNSIALVWNGLSCNKGVFLCRKVAEGITPLQQELRLKLICQARSCMNDATEDSTWLSRAEATMPIIYDIRYGYFLTPSWGSM